MLMGKYDEARTSYQHALTLLNQNSRKHEQCQETYPDLVKANPDCVERCKRIATMIVRMHRLMATVYEQCAEYDSAFEWLERGLSHTRSNDREELASCYLLGASIYQRQGEFNRSLDWARMGLAVARQTGNPSDQSHALLLMGNLWRERGEFSLSIPALEQARALLDQIKDATRLSEVLKNLGDTYHRIGRWQDAVKCYQQSMQISENIGDIRGMARASNNLAVVMVGRDELDFATDLYRYSSEQFRRIGSLLGLALTGYNEAEVMLLQGQARDALHLLRTSITSLENIKARNYLPEAMRLAAEANLALGNIDEAALYGSQSIALASELGMAIEEAVSGRVMGQIAFQRGDFAVASAHLESSRLMLEQLENPYELGRVLYWQARLKQTSGEGEQVAPLLDQAEQIFKNLRARRDLSLVKEMKQTRSE